MNKYKRLLAGLGTGLIILSVVILGAALWEGLGAGRTVRTLDIPGFHELDLDTPGLYAGIYQHQGDEPLPVQALSNLDIRILSKDSYRDVPVLMNSSGQTFSRMGMKGMILFNVLIEQPGFYSMSALYKDQISGPNITVLFIAEAAKTLQMTVLVGIFFFLVFLGLGIFTLIRAKRIKSPVGG
jgi:hypothetical protein